MRPESTIPEPLADEPDPDVVVRAAAIDDYLGGHAAPPPTDGSQVSHVEEQAFAGALDMLLLLRQAAAADGGGRDAAPRQPERIGRYEIIRFAGRGGFSVVWEAFDPVLRRRVALKVRRLETLCSPEMNSRFHREAELASRLVHPHILTIYGVGEDAGRDFITTEFCAGGTLAEWLASHPGPLPPRTAARVVRALARAVAHAHDAGVIHRDIKPANVMLATTLADETNEATLPGSVPPPAAGAAAPLGFTVKLGDFGLGRLDEDAAEPLTQLTAIGARVGTPAWMAPEQIDRSFGTVGPATDIHALGLLLHRLLTGRCLHGGKTDAETYRQILLDEAVPANRLAPGVSPDLAAICAKCLAKRPEDRYASAQAFADDLSRWLEGRPTRARPLSALTRLARGVVRRPVVGALVMAAVVATGAAVWAAFERSQERHRSLVQQAQLRRQNAAAELRRGFDSLRAGNVAGALAQIEQTRGIDPTLADSLAGRWLARRTHGEREILLQTGRAATPADLYGVAVSPDGRMTAVAGADGGLRVLRTIDGRPAVDAVSAHDEINDVCFSPDGRMVATVGQNGRLRWWSVDAGVTLAGEAPPAGCPLYAVAFAPDNDAVFYGGEDRILRRFDLAGSRPPEEVHRFPTNPGTEPEIEVIVRVLDDIAVACGSDIAVFDTADGRLLRVLHQPTHDPSNAVIDALAASPDGSLIAGGGTGRILCIWETASGALRATLPPHPHWIQGCRFSPDGSLLVTACRDGVVRIFDAASGALLQKLVGHAGRVWDVDFETAGTLVTVGSDGTARRWDLAGSSACVLRDVPVTGHAIKRIREATASAPGPNRRLLVASRPYGPPVTIAIDAAETSVIATADRPLIGEMAVDRLRGRVAFGITRQTADAGPLVVPLDAGGASIHLATPADGISTAGPYTCWTPDGRLVTCSHDARLFAWTPALDRVTEIARRSDWPSSCRVEAAPAGPQRIAIGGKPGLILRLDSGAAAGAPIQLDAVSDPISSLAWSPDGSTLACGLRTGAVHVFDGTTGARIGTLAPHERQICDIAYSSDGRVLVTADGECLRISDAATLNTFDELRPGWLIETMCAAADGGFVAIGGQAPAANPAERARLAILDLDPQ